MSGREKRVMVQPIVSYFLHRLNDLLIPFCRASFSKISNMFGRKFIIRASANVCRLSENKNIYLAL